ncbi:MAG: hypothetical protein KKC11_07300 [Candidatus Omnitrophica bacterium]|nr:hypothetical protein [Candidatus Omnitrophota bacterium]MBU1133944.1 hypothetical protein [Candidatus Omnitrophota bacterium]MBU1367636.1 hypothetical protein [Candidatus Omnitrophota bacterium]MBU1523495.1 hypothetical protein [Candidatus Omnitrophota bacterium]MBU1810854.1 hypothetical protein [Candidatus Omnitrophota bacterium]
MKNKNNGVTTVTFLNRQQLDYLDKISKDCLFGYGHKLPRSQILCELVNLLIHLRIDVSKINFGKESLCQGVLKQIVNGNDENEGKRIV